MIELQKTKDLREATGAEDPMNSGGEINPTTRFGRDSQDSSRDMDPESGMDSDDSTNSWYEVDQDLGFGRDGQGAPLRAEFLGQSFIKDDRRNLLPISWGARRISVAAFGLPLTYSGQRQAALQSSHHTICSVLIQDPRNPYSLSTSMHDGYSEVGTSSGNVYAVDTSYMMSISPQEAGQGMVHFLSHDICGVSGCTSCTPPKISPHSRIHPFFSEIPKGELDTWDEWTGTGSYGYRVWKPHSSNSDDTKPGFDGDSGVTLVEKNGSTEVTWFLRM